MTDYEIEKALREADDIAINEDVDCSDVLDYINRLQTELSHREEDLAHADEKVFYREVAVKLEEDKIKKQTVKEFASNVIDLLDEMGMERSSEYNDGYDDGVADCITNIKSRLTELYGVDE